MEVGSQGDQRDTLNRRRDQEQSQQLAAQNGKLLAAHGGQGEIPVEDLCCAIAAMKENDIELIATTTRSPFNQEVHEARLLERFKLSGIKAYDRKSDPQNHLDHFNDLMQKCKVFIVTLTGGAKKSFRSIPARSVTSW